MTSPDGGGQGTQGTYLYGAPARVNLRADAALKATAPANAETIDIDISSIQLLEYWIDERGIPRGYPPCGALYRVVGGTGVPQYTDVPPGADEVNLGCDCRWLPTEDSYTPDGLWRPQFGGNLNWLGQPPDLPYLDEGYSHLVRGGDEVAHNAVVIDGDSWLALDSSGTAAGAFTIILVAVFRPNPEGAAYSILESNTLNVTDPSVIDWALRDEAGTLRLRAGTIRAQHALVFPQSRAVFLALALDPVQAKLMVAGKTKTTVVGSTAGISVYDLQLYLGRPGGNLVKAMTAQMDVLDLAFYGRSLSFDELNDKLHLLDAVYGIVG